MSHDLVMTLSRFFRRGVSAPQRYERKSADSLVGIAYRQILRRPPDAEGLRTYSSVLQKGQKSVLQVLEELLASDEYRSLSQIPGLSIPVVSFSDIPEQAVFSEQLQLEQLSKETYENAWQQVFAADRQLIIGQDEYGRTHKTRFYELFNAVSYLLQQCPQPDAPLVLEFGASEFSGLYQSLFPTATLDFADRPVPDDYIGFTEEKVRRLTGCRNYFVTDLEQPADLFKSGIGEQAYDLLVITEVLEHLVVNPVELCRQLLRLVKPGGFIYLTTPNFYSCHNLQLLQQGRNPTAYYPESDGNWDAHYHHREYSAKELLEIIGQAGGELLGGYFSDCWDLEKDIPVEQRGNMVFVFGHKVMETL